MRRIQMMLIVGILMIVGSAYADTVRVTLSGTYPDSVPDNSGIQGGTNFTISFVTQRNPAPLAVWDENAFDIRVDATYTTSNGSSTTLYPEYESWFCYPSGDNPGTGIDLGFPDWFGTGGRMQIVFLFSTSGYTGTASSPTLELIDLNVWGYFHFYPDGQTYPNDITMDNVHYSAVAESAVPEPASLVLLSAGLAVLGIIGYRRKGSL